MAEYLNINKVFSMNVRQRRLELGMSQEALAHEAGLYRTFISAVERGERNISLKNVEKIAKALAVDYATLLETHT